MNPYQDCKASLIRFVGQTITNDPVFTASGRTQPVVVDFDGVGDEKDLASLGDIMGLEDYSIIDEEGNFTVSARIGLSTIGDKNLFHLRALTNVLFNACLTGKMVPLVDAENANLLGQMKFMRGTNALPMITTELRSYQYLAVSLGYAPSLAPAQP
jgi:hypothetical protein